MSAALNKKSFLSYLKDGGIYVVLLVLLAIIIIQDPTFLSLMNLSNILTQSSVRIIIALGVAGLIVAGYGFIRQAPGRAGGGDCGDIAAIHGKREQSFPADGNLVYSDGDPAGVCGRSSYRSG